MTRIFQAFHVSDLHLNPLNRIPAARTETYHQDTEQELNALKDLIASTSSDALLISGDLFNLKNSSLYHPEHILWYARFFQSIGCPVYTIPGNHDLPHSAYQNLNKSAYALLHEACPNLHSLSEKGSVTISTGIFPITIHGIPFKPVPDFIEATPSVTAQMDSTHLNILLIHTDIAPDTDIPKHWAMISYQELLNRLPNADIVCAGHIHHSYPVFQYQNPTSGRPQVISKPYSFARLVKDYYATMEDLAERHVPTAASITLSQDPDTLAISVKTEYLPIQCVPFQHAFIADTLARELDRSLEISGFLDQIKAQYGSVNQAFHITSPQEFFDRLDIPSAVRKIISQYVEDARPIL